jgi:D-alanine transaminase
MSRYAYVNGRYLPHGAASVHVEDRGYQFADGVYEVVTVKAGRLVDARLHLERLDRSLGELRIARPMGDAALGVIIARMVRLNRLRDGMIYIQVTRGVAPRDHGFPAGDLPPSLVVTAKRLKPQDPHWVARGVRVVTIPDLRWARCDIKSISLLPNVMGKQMAREVGAYEAWQIDRQDLVTEGTSSNAWIVSREGSLVTRHTGTEILNGITRRIVLDLARELALPFEQRPFSRAEALGAREAFLTSATSFVLPVTRIDDISVGDGTPGTFTRALRERYLAHMDQQGARR